MQLRPMVLWVASLVLTAGSTLGPITFEDIAERAAVRFVSNNSATPKKQQPEGLIAGVALLDYDGDGLLDIYFVNGAGMPSLNKEGPQHNNRLFHNDGNLRFSDVTDRAGMG